MNQRTGIGWLLAGVVLLLCGCSGSRDRGRFAFNISLSNLPALGDQGGLYEGWAVIQGAPVSTGKFRVDASSNPPEITNPSGNRVFGTLGAATFGPANTLLGQAFPFIREATAYFITVEPEGDQNPTPSGNVVLEGLFNGDTAILDPSGFSSASLHTATASGFLTTPTDQADSDQNGLWFVSDPAGTPALALPPLLGSWVYEGWVTDGTSVWSTGRFSEVDAPDRDAGTFPGRGPDGVGFAAPGQDFLNPAFTDFADVLDLASGEWRLEIHLEPRTDTSLDPFPLVVLEAPIPTDAVTATGERARDVDLSRPSLQDPAYNLQVAPTNDALSLQAPVGNPGLPSLGGEDQGHFELFGILSAGTLSLVRFVIDSQGNVSNLETGAFLGSRTAFTLDGGNTPGLPDLAGLSAAFVTVELPGDPDPAPSLATLLTASVTLGQGSLGLQGLADFSAAGGSFSLRSPTDDGSQTMLDDARGIWFVAFNDQTQKTLTLPPLPAGWAYEGFVVNTQTGARWSTGRFQDPTQVDDDAATWVGRGPDSVGFDAPGQDFVTSVQPGTLIPTLDLTGGFSAFITIEPSPDSSRAPFITILSGPLPTTPGAVAPFNNLVAANPDALPSGSVSR